MRHFATVLLLMALAGCAAGQVRNPVPAALAEKAHVPGLAAARFWYDEKLVNPDETLRRLGISNLSNTPDRVHGRPEVNYLALSGGADDGAYGAGLLVGWSGSGNRPRFDIVTGISAGALIAPFAFLGPDYDRQLQAMWVSCKPEDLYSETVLTGLLGGPALADSSPLAALIAKHVDRDMLNAVAQEYRKGRLLMVGTTNLDTQRLAVWNMGEIAASGHQHALHLFRQVLLASTAVPGLFPPVRISVEAAGSEREEMHVDGGVAAQVFLLPTHVSFRDLDKLLPAPARHRVFVIRNAKLISAYKPVLASALPVSERSLSTLILNQSLADVQRIYLQTVREGADYNLAAIPATFNFSRLQRFDQQYMRALFQLGIDQSRRGNAWMKRPPSLPVSAAITASVNTHWRSAENEIRAESPR